MLTLVLLGTTLAVVAGLLVKFALPHTSLRHGAAITGVEMVLGTLLCALVLMPAVAGVGFSIARAQAVTFDEYWSGLEERALMDTTVCTKDGPCVREYDCDSYVVMVTKTRQVPDGYTERKNSDGTITRTPKTKTEFYEEPETRWHSCPYTTHEYTFTVTDTLGDTHTMGNHWFPENPSAHRWTGSGYHDARWGSGLPSGVESGTPVLWEQAKARIDAGTPGGVTKVMPYKNYILASSKDIYAKSSSAIETYKADGLLPVPATGTYDHYKADKVYAVGALPGSPEKDWQEALLRFNGTFGSEKQGDLHLVVVTSPQVTNPDEYANALLAYWQSTQLDKGALSKNGYVVIVGSTGGETVEWARGFSGMPIGNERLTVDVREDLTGTALTPEAVLGTPEGKSIDGTLGALIFDEDNGFTRVEMKDYEYLFEQIQPSGGQKTVIVLIGFVLALGIWALFAAIDVRLPAAARQRLGLGSDLYPTPAPTPASFEEEWTNRATDLYERHRRITNPDRHDW